ncbi:MAG: hypothetical protein ACOX0M_09800 [Salinivirgaceae bacterium]|jgi:hypothetical protein|nr:hypothetical protein [Bacteroidales bacterium]
MKTTKSLLATLAIVLFASVTFISCTETLEPAIVKPEDAEELKNSAIQNSQAENATGEALGAIATYGISEDWTKNSKLEDPHVTYDPQTFIVVIRYMESGGSITINWNQQLPTYDSENVTGNVVIAQFTIDNVTINGAFDITYNGGDQPTLLVDGTLNLNMDGNNSVYKIQRTFVWYNGFNTLNDHSDDAFAIYGTSLLTEGTKVFKTEIFENQKVIKYNTCAYPQQGITRMSVVGRNRSVTVDYGVDKDGNPSNECDNYAKFTIKVGSASLTSIVEL